MRQLLILSLSGLLIASGPTAAESLQAALKLTTAQKPLYDAWESAWRGNPAELKMLGLQETTAKTAVILSDNWLAWAEYRLAWSRKSGVAVHALYAALTPAQRLSFDKALMPKGEQDAPSVVPIPADPAPVLINPAAAATTNPDWSRPPTGDELAAFYPTRALHQKMAGSAVIHCDVTTLGVAVNCNIINESPTGYGFGNATIEVASTFRFHPGTVYGVPVLSEVTVPMHWQMEDDRPASIAVNAPSAIRP